MAIDAKVQRGLGNFFADAAVAMDTMDADGGGKIIGGDQEPAV